jgi:hypothetical protein
VETGSARQSDCHALKTAGVEEFLISGVAEFPAALGLKAETKAQLSDYL